MSDESDERKTEPSVADPETTIAEHARVAAYGQSLIAYYTLGERLGAPLKEYIDGDLRAQFADAAQRVGSNIAIAMRAKQDTFEAHISEELAEIRKQNETILSLLRTLTDERFEYHQHVVSLVKWKEKHERGNEHCQSCPYHDEHESQIGAVGGE